MTYVERGALRRGYLDTSYGQVHYATAGEGPPVLLLHHTPRSWTYYRDVIPLLAARHRVVAIDTLGFGASDPAPLEFTSVDLAHSVIEVLDVLGWSTVSLVGAMTGARIAIDVAHDHPQRLRDLVLIAPPWFPDEAARAERFAVAATDHMGVPERDGAHVLKLWRYVLDNLAARDRESAHVPGRYVAGHSAADAPELVLDDRELQYLNDWLIDTLRCGDMWPRAAKAAYGDDITGRLAQLTMPTLVIGGNGMGFGSYLQAENTVEVARAIPQGRFALIDAPDADSRLGQFHAPELAALVLDFLAEPR